MTDVNARFDKAIFQEESDRQTVFNVLSNDEDVDGDALEIVSFANGRGVVGEWFAGDNGGEFCLMEDGCVEFRQMPGEFSSLALDERLTTGFTYTISDGNGGYSTARAEVEVVGQNDDPRAVLDRSLYQEESDRQTVFNVLSNDEDVDGDALEIVSFANGRGVVGEWFAGDNGGEFCLMEDGCVEFRQMPGEFSSLALDERLTTGFTYTISDGNGGYSTARAEVEVVGQNDDPRAVLDAVTTDAEQSVAIDMLSNDTDIDGDDLAIASSSASNRGRIQMVDGKLMYVSESDFVGTRQFDDTILDEGGLTSTEQVTGTVSVTDHEPELISRDVSAVLVGNTDLNEGETGRYKIELSRESNVDRTFRLEITNGTAQRVNQVASGQDIMWGGGYDVRYGVGGRLAYKVFNRVPNGSRLADGDRPMVGSADASWDYTVYQNGVIQRDTLTVVVPAGETMSETFNIQTWLEQVTVDRDSGNASDYNEGAEAFTMQLIDSTTDANLDRLDVTIHDQTNYKFVSPIAIDLDGNGIQSLSINQGVMFDLLNTGTAVKTGWLSKGDGFLAIDHNGNGQIDDRSELFGGNVGDGFAKLATFDSNGDGWVNAADVAFAELSIWQDVNANGETDANELVTALSAGIASLKVSHEKTFTPDAHGNILGERSVAMTTEGAALEMVDVYFQVS